MEDLIIGLCGRAKSGKNTFADIATQILTEGGIDSAHSSFAYPIKKMIVDMFGIPEEYAFGDDKKKNVSFGTWGEFFPTSMPGNVLRSDKMTVRNMLTHLGTDIFRNKVDENFWVKTFQRRTNASLFDKKFITHGGKKILFVTDIRFRNEVVAINDLGGIVLKLDRFVPKVEHLSEDSVDLVPDELFWRILDHEQINGINKLKLQISSILYALEIV